MLTSQLMRWKKSTEEPHRAHRPASFCVFSCHLTWANTVFPTHLSYTLTPTLNISFQTLTLPLLLIQHPCWHSHGEQVWATHRAWEEVEKTSDREIPWSVWPCSQLMLLESGSGANWEWKGKWEGFLNWYFTSKAAISTIPICQSKPSAA